MGEIMMYINDEGGVTTAINSYPTNEDADKMIEALEELKTEKGRGKYEEMLASDKEDRIRRDEEYEASISKSKKKSIGYIYIIRSQNLYKIGRSKRQDCRIKKYQTENPYQIEPIMIAKVDNYITEEKVVMSMVKSKRDRGEWFSLEAKDIEMIKDYMVSIDGTIMELPQ